MVRVFIDGREGTTGLGIDARVRARKDCELLLLSDAERKSPEKRRECIHASDITFLCLPDVAAIEAVALAQGSSARIIDASTAHRAKKNFVYGLPELGKAQYAALENSARTAVPGCHASGFIALTMPLFQAGLLDEKALLHCTSLTGYSGGGKSAIAQYAAEDRAQEYAAPRIYATAQEHKHLPEMLHVTGLKTAPLFLPVIADFYAGMLVTIPLHARQLAKKAAPRDIWECYGMHYANRPAIRVQNCMEGENTFLAANALAGSDGMELFVAGNEERLLLMARYDNLGKGASGAAVQCMNIMLGKDEAEGLNLVFSN